MNVDAHGSAPRLMQLLERQVNRLLRLDSRYPAILSGLSGKIIAVEILDLDQTVIVKVTHGGLELGGEAAVDVRIRGTLPALVAFATARDGRRSASLELHGDVSAAQELQAILSGLDLDWEEALSRWSGDIAARRIGNLARGFMHHARATLRSFGLDTSEYLRFETHLLPVRYEVEQFSSDAEALRDDAERLRLRLDRATQRVKREH